VELK
jgi:nadB: L-aspartate oxidase